MAPPFTHLAYAESLARNQVSWSTTLLTTYITLRLEIKRITYRPYTQLQQKDLLQVASIVYLSAWQILIYQNLMTGESGITASIRMRSTRSYGLLANEATK